MKNLTTILLFCSFFSFGQNNDCELPVFLERNPEFKGGYEKMESFIYKNLVYPSNAKEAKIEGTVFVEFRVDTKGKVDCIAVVKKIGFGCDEEAVRLVKLTNKKWVSAKNNHKKVATYLHIHIAFKWPDDE